jgi:hypothetical protein
LVDVVESYGEIKSQGFDRRRSHTLPITFHDYTVEIETGLEKFVAAAVFHEWYPFLDPHYRGTTVLKLKLELSEEDRETGEFKQQASWWFTASFKQTLQDAFETVEAEIADWAGRESASDKADFVVGFEVSTEGD